MSFPDLTVRASVRSSLQEAADFFKQNNEDEAYRVIDEKLGNLYRDSKITTNQLDTVYRTVVHDPLLNPQTPFSKRQYIPVVALKGKALRDLVQFYSAKDLLEDPKALKDGPEKRAVLGAAELFENGDEQEARNLLEEIFAHPSEHFLHEEIGKELAQIVRDDFRDPQSPFLKRHVAQNPLVDPNRLRGKALELLSMHIFEEDVVQGVLPLPPSPKLPERLLFGEVVNYSDVDDLALLKKASKGSIADIQASLQYRKEATLEEVREWRKIGLRIDEGTLPALRCIRGMVITSEDANNLSKILVACPHLEEIDLDASRSDLENHYYLRMIGKCCLNLLRFTLRGCSTKTPIDSLFKGCKKLQHIDLKYSHFGRSGVNSSDLVPVIAENCPELISINLAFNSSDDVKKLLDKCKHVTHLAATYSGWFSTGDQFLFELGKYPRLKNLTLYDFRAHSFSSEGMQAIAKGCPSLEHLAFESSNLKDGFFSGIGDAALPQLKTFVHFAVGGQGSAQEEALAKKAPNLTFVYMTNANLSDDSLRAFGVHCPGITTLNISNNPNITCRGIRAITDRCPQLTRLTLNPKKTEAILQTLTNSRCNLTHFSMPEADSSAEEIIAFVRKNRNLTNLDFGEYQHVDDDVLAAIGELLPHLVSIDLSRTNVTPIGIALLGKKCPNLRSLRACNLNIYKNRSEITKGDLLIEAIAQNFPKLTKLIISRNPKLEPDGRYSCNFGTRSFALLGKGCPNLNVLDVSGNHLSPQHFAAIASSFFHLKQLVCFENNCPSAFQDMLRKNSPSVKITPKNPGTAS